MGCRYGWRHGRTAASCGRFRMHSHSAAGACGNRRRPPAGRVCRDGRTKQRASGRVRPSGGLPCPLRVSLASTALTRPFGALAMPGTEPVTNSVKMRRREQSPISAAGKKRVVAAFLWPAARLAACFGGYRQAAARFRRRPAYLQRVWPQTGWFRREKGSKTRRCPAASGMRPAAPPTPPNRLSESPFLLMRPACARRFFPLTPAADTLPASAGLT